MNTACDGQPEVRHDPGWTTYDEYERMLKERVVARMNPDKITKWMELAKHFAGQDFWSDLFEEKEATAAFHRNPPVAGKTEPTAPIYPAADVLTSNDEIIVLVDLPGVSKDDIQLSIHEQYVLIKGEAKPMYPGHSAVSTERFTGSFERPIGLPIRIDKTTTGMKASFHRGTLIIRIPLAPVWKTNIPID